VRHHCPGVAIILGGTKLDLVQGGTDGGRTLETLRQRGQAPVTVEEAMRLAEEIGAVAFVPYSSLTQENLKFLMDECMRGAFGGGALLPKKKAKQTGCVVN